MLLPLMRLYLPKPLSVQPETHALNPLRLLQLLLMHSYLLLLLLQAARATSTATAWQWVCTAPGQRLCKDRHIVHICVALLYCTAEQYSRRRQRYSAGLQRYSHGSKAPLWLYAGVKLFGLLCLIVAAGAGIT